uniref:Uncharacterized protein n=1 Tax=Desulfacinum infernum TaxID=35837 RepID=A0A832EKD1_9BACT
MNPRLLGFALVLCAFFLVVPALAQVDYPEDLKGIVAQYPGSQVEMAMKTPQGSHVVLTTSDPPQKAYAYYKEALTKAGWETEMEMTHKEGQQGHWKKGDKMTHVVVTKDEDKTQIVLLVGTN